jgi:hypothetical protein
LKFSSVPYIVPVPIFLFPLGCVCWALLPTPEGLVRAVCAEPAGFVADEALSLLCWGLCDCCISFSLELVTSQRASLQSPAWLCAAVLPVELGQGAGVRGGQGDLPC